MGMEMEPPFEMEYRFLPDENSMQRFRGGYQNFTKEITMTSADLFKFKYEEKAERFGFNSTDLHTILLDMGDYIYEASFEKKENYVDSMSKWVREKIVKLLKRKRDIVDDIATESETMSLTFSNPSKMQFYVSGFLEGNRWWEDGTQINFVLDGNRPLNDVQVAGNLTAVVPNNDNLDKTVNIMEFMLKRRKESNKEYQLEITSEFMKDEKITIEYTDKWPNKTAIARIPKIKFLDNEELEIKFARGGTITRVEGQDEDEDDDCKKDYYCIPKEDFEEDFVPIQEVMIRDHTLEIKKNNILSNKMTINFVSFDDMIISIYSPKLFKTILQQTFETLEIEGKMLDSIRYQWKTNFQDTTIISALKTKKWSEKCRENFELEDCLFRYNLTVNSHEDRMVDFSYVLAERGRDVDILRFDLHLNPSILCGPSKPKEICMEDLEFYLLHEEIRGKSLNFNPKITVVKYGESTLVTDGLIRVQHPRIFDIKSEEELIFVSGLFFGEKSDWRYP